jgi:uroporphyrinogen-III synthase
LTVRVLLTRPEPDAQRTAAALRARGHEVIIAPLLHIEILSNADLGAGPWAAILVTSANAVRAIAAHRRRAGLHTVPVFAVGQRSAQAMREAGFADVASADGNVDDLANLVAARMKPGMPLLYLAGEERSGDLAGVLRARNFTVQTVLVYRAIAAATLPRHASDALTAGIDAVLHFSRRSAEAYVSAARDAGGLDALTKPVHLCLSGRIAEPLTAAGATKIRVAGRPEEAALLELLERA